MEATEKRRLLLSLNDIWRSSLFFFFENVWIVVAFRHFFLFRLKSLNGLSFAFNLVTFYVYFRVFISYLIKLPNFMASIKHDSAIITLTLYILYYKIVGSHANINPNRSSSELRSSSFSRIHCDNWFTEPNKHSTARKRNTRRCKNKTKLDNNQVKMPKRQNKDDAFSRMKIEFMYARCVAWWFL